MTKTIIHLDPEPIFEVLGRNGERWRVGWGNWDEPGAEVVETCLHGAIRRCAPVKGDAYILEEVGERFGFGIGFNDANKWPVVRDRIAEGFDITGGMLKATFGPNWAGIVKIVRTIASASIDDLERLPYVVQTLAPWSSLSTLAGVDIWNSTWSAVSSAGHHAAGNATAVRVAGWDAAKAVLLRDYIGKPGMRQADHDRLLRAWVRVFGEPMPRPAPVASEPKA